MVFEPKCILVTGATSEGIGRALALELLNISSHPKVIITGRRQERLDEVASKSNRLFGKRLDQTASRDDLKKWVTDLLQEYPELDTVILNAGIQYQADWAKPESFDIEKLEQEIYTNYTSQMILANAFIPHFLKLAKEGKQVPRLATVTSGLSITPSPNCSNYSATKAALHSLTLSMRASLQKTGVKIIEIVPPLVESQLHDDQGTTEKLSKFWMPLKEFRDTVIQGLKDEKDVIPAGHAVANYEEHEAGKHNKVAKMVQN